MTDTLESLQPNEKVLTSDLYQKLKDFHYTSVPGLDLIRPNNAPAEKLGKTYAVQQWMEDSFDPIAEIEKLNGTLLEVGGPTLGDYRVLNTNKLQQELHRKLHVTNIYPDLPQYPEDPDLIPTSFYGKVDFQVDATNLSLRDKSVAALFASNLPADIREQVLTEAKRVLQSGGLLIWQGTLPEDLQYAQKLGYQIKEYLRTVYFNRGIILDLILQKS